MSLPHLVRQQRRKQAVARLLAGEDIAGIAAEYGLCERYLRGLARKAGASEMKRGRKPNSHHQLNKVNTY
jgi:hypothetical protein